MPKRLRLALKVAARAYSTAPVAEPPEDVWMCGLWNSLKMAILAIPCRSFGHLLGKIVRPPRSEGFVFEGRPFSHKRWQKDPPDHLTSG